MAYYWYIRPCKDERHLRTRPDGGQPRLRQDLGPRRGLTPVSASGDRTTRSPSPPRRPCPTVADDVQFSWIDYLATNAKTARTTETGERSDQAARGYHLQVSTTPAFGTLVDETTVDQTTYTAFNKTYPEGQLYWRIQAIDGSGNGLAWSAPMGFVKGSDPVTLTSPVADSKATSTQPLKWQPLKFAASYDIEVYQNADTNASSANRVLSANSKQVAYTIGSPLAPQSYVWRVRRVDFSSRKGAWSKWGSFKVGGGAPVLATPTSGAFVAGKDALFAWTPVAGATSYRFERRQAGVTYSSETVNTVSPQWAPSAQIPDGSWEWSVSSLDAYGRVTAGSGWRALQGGLGPSHRHRQDADQVRVPHRELHGVVQRARHRREPQHREALPQGLLDPGGGSGHAEHGRPQGHAEPVQQPQGRRVLHGPAVLRHQGRGRQLARRDPVDGQGR